MNTVGLFDVRNIGAQYLHLRCGPDSPSLRLHEFCYHHPCAIWFWVACFSFSQVGLVADKKQSI